VKQLLALGLVLLAPVGVFGQTNRLSVELLPEEVRVEIKTQDVQDLSRVLTGLSATAVEEVELFHGADVSSSQIDDFIKAAIKNRVRAANVSLEPSLAGEALVLGFRYSLEGERQTTGRAVLLSLAQVAPEVAVRVAPQLQSALVWEFQRMFVSAGFERVTLKRPRVEG
jgi:hypothetical protein